MHSIYSGSRLLIPMAVALLGSAALAHGQDSSNNAPPLRPSLAEDGRSLFLQHCAFCHGRDAGGGETGPDLTNSQLVAEDVKGDKIGVVVKNGRPEKGMPRFNLSDGQIASL